MFYENLLFKGGILMKKKIFTVILALMISLFAFNICLANEEHPIQDATNSVRNAVGGAENAIENGVEGIGNMTKDATNSMETTMNNAGKDVKNSVSPSTNNGNSYSATRTSTGGAEATFMGMNSTVWTWLIIGIAAIAIVALVWYYSSQITNDSNNKRM